MLLALPAIDLSFLREGRLILFPVNQRCLPGLHRILAEKDPLGEFPGFNTREEEDRCNDHDRPLPGDHLMLEDHAIDDRNVESREDCDKTEDDGPEQKLVAANIVDPIGEIMCQSQVSLH